MIRTYRLKNFLVKMCLKDNAETHTMCYVFIIVFLSEKFHYVFVYRLVSEVCLNFLRNRFPALTMSFVIPNVSMCAGFLRAVEWAQQERALAAFAKGSTSLTHAGQLTTTCKSSPWVN